MILGRPRPTLVPSPPNLGETILETPNRAWRWRCSGSRNTHGRATKPGPPPSAPRINQAFISRELASRPNSCPAYRKARGPTPVPGTPGGPSNPLRCSERLLRPRLLLQGGPPPPLPGLAAALTMTAAGRGRVPPAPFLRSPGRRPGQGGPTAAAAALARPRQPRSAPRSLRHPPPTTHTAPPTPDARPHSAGRARTATLLYPATGRAPSRPLIAAPRPVTSARTVLCIRRARSLSASFEQKREKL